MPYCSSPDGAGAKGKLSPVSYHASVVCSPHSQISRLLTFIAFHVSGAMDRCAKSVPGVHVCPFSRADTYSVEVSELRTTKYPSMKSHCEQSPSIAVTCVSTFVVRLKQ